MPSVFSASPILGDVSSQDVQDDEFKFQLMQDSELLDLWEQTQQAAIAFAERGMRPEPLLADSRRALREIQRRLFLRPQGFILGMKEPELFQAAAEAGR